MPDSPEKTLVFRKLQENFFTKFSLYVSVISTMVGADEADSYIAASAFASLTSQELRTSAFGNDNDLEVTDDPPVVLRPRPRREEEGTA